MENPLRYFAELQDPRAARTRRRLLQDIVLIAIAAILSGAGGWDEIERYGKAKKSWLKSFLQLPHGIPSHDTFNRVFQALDPAELEESFLDWVRLLNRLTAALAERAGLVENVAPGLWWLNGLGKRCTGQPQMAILPSIQVPRARGYPQLNNLPREIVATRRLPASGDAGRLFVQNFLITANG